MKYFFVISSLSIFFGSCNMSDSSEELPGDYTFVHEGEEYNYIDGKHTIYSNVVEYVYNSDYILACQIPNRPLYLSQLQFNLSGDYYCYNSYMKDSTSEKFYKSRSEILGDSIIFKVYKNKKISLENSSEDIKKGELIADSIIKNDPIHKKVFSLRKVYWIIKLKQDILVGPLSESEYKLKRKELNVNENLRLSIGTAANSG